MLILEASTIQEGEDTAAAGHEMLTTDAWGRAWTNYHENNVLRMVPGVDERIKRSAKVQRVLLKIEMVACDPTVKRMVLRESMTRMSREEIMVCEQTTSLIKPVVVDSEVV